MSDVLCVYYSRSGHTKKSMETIAAALDAELLELRDGVSRTGVSGFVRCGLDAVRKTCPTLEPFETERPINRYRMVIIGTPVWGGRCSAPVRCFLQDYGHLMRNAAYIITRSSREQYESVYDQMDSYTLCGHRVARSLRNKSEGHDFWEEEFLREVRAALPEVT